VKKLILPVIILLYVCYLIFMLAPSGHHYNDVYSIVESHLSDHAISAIQINNEDNIIVSTSKTINNSIADFNTKYLSEKIFGIFDMRITRWLIMLWFNALFVIVIFTTLARQLKKSPLGSKSRWVNLWEVLITTIQEDIIIPSFDHKYIKLATPYFLTLFFFVFFCNSVGLFPGLSTASGNLAVTGGLSICTLLIMMGVGFIKQGPLWIVTGIVPGGIPKAIFPILWALELLGLIIKPFSLILRLFANMLAGHIVIIVFLYLAIMFETIFVALFGVPMSLMIYALEALVVLIQAYIFTTLSAMYIGSSLHAH
jgi:F-type H+-transporting ATPase subunit a